MGGGRYVDGWMGEEGMERREGDRAGMVCQQNAADDAVGSAMRREEIWPLA